MEAIEILLNRQSAAKLAAPAPAGAARERIFRTALRAPDHGRMRPWRFLVVEGDARAEFGEAMARAMTRHNPASDEAVLAKLRANPLRAPLLLVLLARIVPNPKVPEIEQVQAFACSVHAMMIAAQAEGFGAMWRTGAVTYLPELHAELGLASEERVLGFLYLGTPDAPARPLEQFALGDYFRSWPA